MKCLILLAFIKFFLDTGESLKIIMRNSLGLSDSNLYIVGQTLTSE